MGEGTERGEERGAQGLVNKENGAGEREREGERGRERDRERERGRERERESAQGLCVRVCMGGMLDLLS